MTIDKLKKTFKDKTLIETALTHKSWVNEHKKIRESNERLEFLGDAVLEFIVSREIYNKFPDKEEGYLTALRANIVNTVSLAHIASKLNISPHIYLSKGEEESGGRDNQSIMANTVEAIIGAIFLDQGIDSVYKFIDTIILTNLSEIVSRPLKDAKSRLQEFVQAKGFPTPRYSVIKESGPDHAKKFTLDVLVDEKPWGRGEGKNKSEAAQAAARNALKTFL